MQEEVENRTLNLAISTTKLSGRTLLAAFRKYMQHRRNVKAKKLAAENEKPVGEQTIDQLLGQNQGATNIEIEKTDIKGFKRFLRCQFCCRRYIRNSLYLPQKRCLRPD